MAGALQYEIPAEQADRATNFFETVFGWAVERRGSTAQPWLLGTPRPGAPRACRLHGQPGLRTIVVDDLHGTLKRIETAGGEVVVPPHAAPGVGALAFFSDTERNVWGLCEGSTSGRDERAA
jgi:uncharacterized protein